VAAARDIHTRMETQRKTLEKQVFIIFVVIFICCVCLCFFHSHKRAHTHSLVLSFYNTGATAAASSYRACSVVQKSVDQSAAADQPSHTNGRISVSLCFFVSLRFRRFVVTYC
jgi:hypothetical protein